MNKIGWPKPAITWLKSFLQERSARVRQEDGVTDPAFLECGLPQGSPLSPILFLFYMAEVVGGSSWRFGYADDVAILGIGSTPTEAAVAVQREVDAVLGWAADNAVSFDPDKAEVVYLVGPRSSGHDLPAIRVDTRDVQGSDNIRWLGVHLDRGLTLESHVAKWTSKAMRLLQHFRRLTLCTQGPRPDLLTTVIRTVVLPIAMHAAEVWCPGPTRETYQGVTRNSYKRQSKVVDQTSAFGIRVALPTWRTMPIAALRRETGIPPAHILLEERRLKTAARIRRLDEYHPLRLRATESTDSARHRLGLKTCNKTRLGFDRVHD